MTRWLMSLSVTRVAMEATGVYSMPVYHALLEYGRFEQVLICNAAHVKNVPGRKTDAVDAAWLAELLECGLLRGSYIPDQQTKAVRDLTRYRKRLVGERSSETQRLGAVLQDAGIKLDSVASSLSTRIRTIDDRRTHRRGTPWRGAGRAGAGPDARQDPGPGGRPGRPLR